MYLLEFLYLPFLMNTIPFGACQLKTSRAGYNPHNCDTNDYAKYVLLAILVVALCFAVLYVMALITHVAIAKVSHNTKTHENFVQQKEIEFLLHCSPLWKEEVYAIFSSFGGRKLRMYHRALFNVWVLGLVLTHSFLVKPTTQNVF